MNRIDLHTRGVVAPHMLAAGLLLAVISVFGILLSPNDEPLADITLNPTSGMITLEDTFIVTLNAHAETPVNVFAGELEFDHTRLRVESIEYNTSIADLWAKRPWYENGEGTINFIGGTTQQGGFTGTGPLMTITFKPTAFGPAYLRIRDASILAHDGLGSFTPLGEPIDALFTVEGTIKPNEVVALPKPPPIPIAVVPELPKTDLNADGEQSITDVSIFMVRMAAQDVRADFNGDADIDLSDLSILLSRE